MSWKIVFPVFAAFLAVVGCGLLVGGRRAADVNSEGVQNALSFAVRQHNKATNDQFLVDVVRVLKAETQVVSGVNYFITVMMGRTQCKKTNQEPVCAMQEEPEMARQYICTFTVYNVPWTRTISLTEQTCTI
ncbi:cystatin C (amyloid angiopathy and cerebral hemorrhage) [Genypterus blacodes]|uniref:cystatin C (amyloid angiopathy and cerebral hemorrhage) n=1 Tax=Genypterus blacodes TaxID=154954 RepID=UPI003F762039